MSTLEMVFAGLAFIAVGLPICILFAVLVPVAVWRIWTVAFLTVLQVHDDCREAWDRRRARKAGA